MKRVYQQFIDKNKGDCMRAAIASLFEMEYDQVPNFIEEKDGYFHTLWDFLKKTEYKYKGMLHNPLDKTDVYTACFISELSKYNGVDGYFYASVYSPKYFDKSEPCPTTHAVLIDKNYNIVHDPNPGNQDIKAYPMSEELQYNGIVNVFLFEKGND